MKSRTKKHLALVLGMCLCAYPLVASIFERCDQQNAISTYKSQIETNDADTQACIESAVKYNEMLHQSQKSVVAGLQDGILSEENYLQELNLTRTGMMGSIEIPKISVNLPIYHGTSDAVLANAVGHIEGTSLPVGGNNTHSILTGHRGLPSSQLFTRLDEMEEGDLFYIKVCDEVLAYQVRNIQIIKPEEVDCLEIQQDKDLVSLITCHPYGINTHRLVITGERTTYEETEYLSIAKELPSLRELVFMVLPFVLLVAVILNYIKERKEKKHAETKIS